MKKIYFVFRFGESVLTLETCFFLLFSHHLSGNSLKLAMAYHPWSFLRPETRQKFDLLSPQHRPNLQQLYN